MTSKARSQECLTEEVTPPEENGIAILRKLSKCFPKGTSGLTTLELGEIWDDSEILRSTSGAFVLYGKLHYIPF